MTSLRPTDRQRGIALERSKQWDRAEKDFTRALELEPDQPLVLNYLGYAWVEQGKNMEEALSVLAGVENVMPVLKPYQLASMEGHPERSIIDVNGVKFGGPEVVVVAGPCSVESREQILESAEAVKEGGGHVLRGGAFKPRTSPYSFQGLEEEGLRILSEAREETGLPVVTEVVSVTSSRQPRRYIPPPQHHSSRLR